MLQSSDQSCGFFPVFQQKNDKAADSTAGVKNQNNPHIHTLTNNAKASFEAFSVIKCFFCTAFHLQK